MTSARSPHDSHRPMPGEDARSARNIRRPRTESLSELAVYTVVAMGIMFVVVMPMLSPRDHERLGEVLGSLATGLGNHVDALLETTATTLVTFYLFIAGQELANRQRGVSAASHELSLRRTLSTVGLMLAAVNIAACVALVAASGLSTTAIGALPAIIPLTALCTLGALWLDQFSLADRDLRRGYAERDLARADALTARLRQPEGMSPWVLSVLHVLLATVVAFAVFVIDLFAAEGRPSAEDVALLPAMALLFLVVAAMWLTPMIALRAPRPKFGQKRSSRGPMNDLF